MQQLVAAQGGVRGSVAAQVVAPVEAQVAPVPEETVTVIRPEMRRDQLSTGDRDTILGFVAALLDFLNCLGVFGSTTTTNSTDTSA